MEPDNRTCAIPAFPIDAQELAHLLGVSLTSIWRLKKAGKLPFHQIGGAVRFFPNDVATIVANTARGSM